MKLLRFIIIGIFLIFCCLVAGLIFAARDGDSSVENSLNQPPYGIVVKEGSIEEEFEPTEEQVEQQAPPVETVKLSNGETVEVSPVDETMFVCGIELCDQSEDFGSVVVATINVWNRPVVESFGAKVVYKVQHGDSVEVVGIAETSDGMLWNKFEDDGWLDAMFVTASECSEDNYIEFADNPYSCWGY